MSCGQCSHLRSSNRDKVWRRDAISLGDLQGCGRNVSRLQCSKYEVRDAIPLFTSNDIMRLPILGLLLGLVSVVCALSATGNKLLVILEEESEKNKYSQFFKDLESMSVEQH